LAILKAKDALYGKERFRNLRELSEVLEGRKKVETDFQGTMLNVARRRLIFSALSLPLERLCVGYGSKYISRLGISNN